MAYMNQDRKAKIKAALDVALKGTGVKYTLRCDNLSITCRIKSAPIDLISNINETCGKDFYQVSSGFRPITDGCSQVNPYHFKNHFSGAALDIMTRIVNSMYAADYYDHSDVQSDYFCTAYYVHVNIGEWDKPFIVK